MIRNVLLDTGPLIALLDRRDQYHAWARDAFSQVVSPLLTCEAVLAEACFLATRANGRAVDPLRLVERGVVIAAFSLTENIESVAALMDRYRDLPMSLADACIVRMSEQLGDCRVLTLDSDFRVYRRNRRQRIPVWMPSDR